jgi:SAM-dependent methyltransferase
MAHSFKNFIKTLEFPYCYYVYIIDSGGDLDYLHYGLWEPGTQGLKDAQENLAAKMKGLITKDMKRILDVGCGLGRTTHDLAASGHNVIGISPDIKLMEMAKAKYSEYVSNFVISSFEDYRSKDLFDLILFQESSQYVNDLDFLFSHCNELLNNTGSILMCDEIRYKDSHNCAFHEKRNIEKIAPEYGFNIMHNENITDKVLETRKIALHLFTENKDSVIEEFSPIRENTREEVESLIEGWKIHTTMFEKGIFGYEVFLFQRGSSSSQ